MTGLVDCNNFFVSCERSINPDLLGRPVVVMSNNDGCVVARSNEAKALGIKMGQPVFEIRPLIEEKKVIALSGNHLLYRDISLKVHEIFRRYVPSSIDYSCDEAFLNVKGIPVNALMHIGLEIRRACEKEVSIPVTIGFAPTRVLAKLTTDLSKKSGQYVSVINSYIDLEAHLKKLPVNELWGIGNRLYKHLFEEGVFTIWDLIKKDRNWIRKKYGVNGERLWLELNDIECIDLSSKERILQESISETRTFPFHVDDHDWINARIAIYAADCAAKLRRMKGECGNVGVFLATNIYHTDNGEYHPFLTEKMTRPTSDTSIIVKSAQSLFARIYDSSFSYKRAGVILSDIRPEGSFVPSLFDLESERFSQTPKLRSLYKAIDTINEAGGDNHIKLASQITPGHPGHNDGFSISFHAVKKK